MLTGPGHRILGATILNRGPLGEVHLKLEPGVTVLYGKNGAGKSRLLAEIQDLVSGHAEEWVTGEHEPPRHVWYSLEEALELLAVLEDARDALTDSGHLVVVVDVEAQVRDLNRRLDFADPEGDDDAR